MALAQEDIEQIRRLIREEVEARISAGVVRYDLELRERIVRVEEELKHQRELMEQGFRLMDKRFEEMLKYNENRFEQIDKHLGEMRGDMNQRFESLTTRIDRFMRWSFALTIIAAGLVVAAIKYLP